MSDGCYGHNCVVLNRKLFKNNHFHLTHYIIVFEYKLYVHQWGIFSSLTNDFHFNIIISNNYKNVSRIITAPIWNAINSKFCFIKTVNTMEFEELKTYFLTIVVDVNLIGIAKLQFIGVFCTWVNIKYLPTM